jgi:hypothetical protein
MFGTWLEGSVGRRLYLAAMSLTSESHQGKAGQTFKEHLRLASVHEPDTVQIHCFSSFSLGFYLHLCLHTVKTFTLLIH